MKNDIIQMILVEMDKELNCEQLLLLQNCLNKNLYNVELIFNDKSKENELSTNVITNEMFIEKYITCLKIEQNKNDIRKMIKNHW